MVRRGAWEGYTKLNYTGSVAEGAGGLCHKSSFSVENVPLGTSKKQDVWQQAVGGALF